MTTDDLQPDGAVPSGSSVAELLNRLFVLHRRDDGREHTNAEVAAALKHSVTASYLSKLRRGEVTNPSRNVLKELCLYFRVPAAYFFPELAALAPRDDDVGQQQLTVALRAYGIPADMDVHIEALIKAVRQEHTDSGT